METAMYLIAMLLSGIVLGWLMSRQVVINVNQNVVSEPNVYESDNDDGGVELSPDDTPEDEDDD